MLFVIVAGIASCKTNKNQTTVKQDQKEGLPYSAPDTKINVPLVLEFPVKINIDSELYAKLEKDAIRASQNKNDTLFAFIKRTPCYGRCPIYSASFYKSGYVIYRGERFVEKQGIYSARISQDQLISITKMAHMVNYMALDKEYDTAVTDLPSTYTSINLNGTKKEIKNRAGGPDELRSFESHLDRILDGANWTKIGDIRQ